MLGKDLLEELDERRRVVIMVNKKSEFSWKIWMKKVAKNAVYVIVAGCAAMYADSPYWLAIAPIMRGIENYVRNK